MQHAPELRLANPHLPPVSVGAQTNTDAEPVPALRQADMYCGKYCTKHHKRLGSKRALSDIIDDICAKDVNAWEKYGDSYQESHFGQKVYKVLMAEVGEEVSQTEVAHHANRCQEYFCSRPAKHVYVYKKASAIAKPRKKPIAAAPPEDAEPTMTTLAIQPSDLSLYGRRFWYSFWPQGETPSSPYVPLKATPEEQLV